MPIPQDDLQIHPLAPPIGGINARESLFAMPETDARELVNMIPEPYGLRMKEGVYGYDNTAANQESHMLAEFLDAANAEFIVRAADNKFYDVSSGDTNITGAAVITSNLWQWTQFQNRLFFVNGTDAPLHWQGTGFNVAATAWTGSGLTITNLINVSHYRRRLYFVEKDSLSVWWPESLDNITGVLKETSFDGVCKYGGGLRYAGPVSSSLNSTDQLMCFITSAGEILVYTGDWPDALNWRIIGQYHAAPPIGYRCAFHVDGDLWVMTRSGLISVQALMAGDNTAISDKISNDWRRFTSTYGYYKSWFGVYFPERDYVLINIPESDLGGVTFQLGYHRVTKSWFTFYDWNTHAMCYSKGRGALMIHPIDAAKVYFGDMPNLPGVDPDGELLFSFRQSFSPLGAGNRPLQKALTQIELFLELSTNPINDPPTLPYTEQISVGFDVDYQYDAQEGGQSQDVIWDTTTQYLQHLTDVVGEGKVVGMKMIGIFDQPVQLKYNGANIYWVNGGIE